MSKLSVSVNRVWEGSTIAKVSRLPDKSLMRIVIPELVILDNKGFSDVEQVLIKHEIEKRQQVWLMQAAKCGIGTDLEI